MRHFFATAAQRGLVSALLGAAALLIGNTALAISSSALPIPQPFEAQYRLEIRGWPGATITHKLTHEGSHWLSDMSFSIAVARGQERSRFSLDESGTHSLLYSSSYSLFGIGDSYQLAEGDIRSIDRQAALFDLSRRAGFEGCIETSPCDLAFVDHRGRDEHFQYYVNAPTTISVPAGEFDAKQVTLVDAEKPDRHLLINFHPEWPGLILSAEYQKEGRKQTTLTMTQFNPAGGNAP
ncbi:hypothetical protein [Vreelandella aquamarina]|uniref:hypothetical protein n=1 Tax=Vreelandella aquamarina TaxID=77097 RepID=UPI00384F196C